MPEVEEAQVVCARRDSGVYNKQARPHHRGRACLLIIYYEDDVSPRPPEPGSGLPSKCDVVVQVAQIEPGDDILALLIRRYV